VLGSESLLEDFLVPKDSFSWLHLTDFHYGLNGQDCLWPNLREPFLKSLETLHKQCGPWQAVFFTGDLVQSGESAQFAKMQTEVLDPLWAKLAELGSGDAVLLAVPGNHDLYRPNPKSHDFDDPAMVLLLQPNGYASIEATFWRQPLCTYRRAIGTAFSAYTEWWEGARRKPPSLKTGALPGDFSATIQHGKRRIGIIGLNTTFLQLAEGNYEERLVWDARQLHAVCEGGVDTWTKQHDICLLLTHQGPEWLTAKARKHGESEIAPAGRFAAQLFGHMHETKITYIRHGGGTRAVRLCQGCSVFGLDKFGEPPEVRRVHGYSAGRIEFGANKTSLRLWPRIATDKAGGWRFIPDHDHAILGSDEGTVAERLASGPAKAHSSPAKSAGVARRTIANPKQLLGTFVPHSTLPVRRPFFGRKPDLERIAKYLLPDDRSWGVVLDGPGGVGKTSLALEAAHQAPAEHFPLKLWITAKSRELQPDGEQQLRDHRVSDYYALLTELGLAVGRDDISRAIPEDRPALVRHALANHRALLVLDNLESFSAEERRRLFELLGNLPVGCRAIVTSRRRTDGSSAAHPIRLDKLEREAADELLAELGQRCPPITRLSPNERDGLYAETGGNPLLLTWTASQLGRTTGRCHTIAEAIERLQEAHRLEKLSQRNDPLEFIFGDLIETFTPNETKVLTALVHFTLPARVAWLLPLTKLGSKAAETALDGLRDRALLVEDDVAGTWWLPPLAARFLRRARPEEVGVSGDRLGDWAYANAVESGRHQYHLFSVLEAAWPQLAAALPVLITGESSRLLEFCQSIINFLETSGRWDEIILLSTAIETKANNSRDFSTAASWVIWSGAIYFWRGELDELKDCSDRCAGYVEAGTLGAEEQMWSTRLKGHWLALTEDLHSALDAYRDMIKLARRLSPGGRRLSATLQVTANCLQELGQLEEAETYAREALAIARKDSDHIEISGVTGTLSQIALDREQWVEAERLARKGLSISERVQDILGIAIQSRNLAEALARQNRGTEGLRHAEYAVRILTTLRSRRVDKARATLARCQ
jgi:tetratricopeptide (TPR) repeat protein